LVQRQIRPMVRDKARAAVEFGAKISVSARNGFAFSASDQPESIQ
jgi:hypothetical protein